MITKIQNLPIANKQNLTKKERLNSEKQIGRLFEEGKSIKSGCLRMVYLFIEDEVPSKIQVMFSVPKKNFKKAVDRNMLKRRMREAYRLSKPEINDDFSMNILIAFIFIDKEISPYLKIEYSIQDLLRKFIKRITPEKSNI
jgi:ribonuclease P protein component